ncbi:107-domain-containing protein [Amylocarpus encephaloides]|uniref:Nuclear pore complex protein n=1 Tax=Amylocarpus encephaloides TaxID=45428 RepID=A0A9P7YJ31_9HELO|nr:107-domain-containing protein [Amylocarpus encephaloides]
MAPLTRSGASSIPLGGMESLRPPRQKQREASWQFITRESRSDRELSIEPASSYDDQVMDEEDTEKHLQLKGPEDHEDILHPLREAANRVGREVERFAEELDGYNPLRAPAGEERHELTIELMHKYHAIAKETVGRLRGEHGSERQRKDDKAGRKKMRGFKIAQNTDELDYSDFDDEHPTTPADKKTTVDDLERWEQEVHTWDLLARLVERRHQPPGSDKSKSAPRQRTIHKYSTEKDLWNDFLDNDEIALERKTVISWFNDTAEESGEDIDDLVQELQQNAERGEIIAHGWLHTKAAIKNSKRLLGAHGSLDPSASAEMGSHKNTTRTEMLVTQLDPDVVTRQDRKLQAEDQYFERAIWLGCYEMLRRGRSQNDIKEWCAERTEIWRAVSMTGLPVGDDHSDEKANPESWVLWRRMCFALAHNGGGDEYERAVYGILSGDVSSVEPVCRTWDDFVFTHYNALLRTQFDTYLQSVSSLDLSPATLSNFGAFDAVQFHGEQQSVAERFIENLGNDPRTKQEAMKPMKMLQGVLIANRFEHFIHQQGLALSKFANAEKPSNMIPVETVQPTDLERYIALDDHDSLRVLTHILLIYMSLGIDLGGIWTQTAVENVIVAYVSFLRLANKEELIPLYCSQLTGPRRYAIMSRNLIDITDNAQRVTQITLMKGLGLDVQEFVRMQSRYLLHDHPDNSKGYPATSNFRLFRDTPGLERSIHVDFLGEGDIDRPDLLLIRSLEWYLLVGGLWSETFIIGTMLYLRFFKHVHLHAARILALRLNSDYIASRKTKAILGEQLDFNGLEDSDEDLTEVLDDSADNKRLLKQQMIIEAKNYREMETLMELLDIIETATGTENIVSPLSAEECAGVDWRQKLANSMLNGCNVAPIFMKGWLLTAPNEESEAEFALLRKAYLPETILAFIRTLDFAGRVLSRNFLMECMDLSAKIADEECDVLPLFEQSGKMQQLVQGFAVASKTLLLLSSEKKSTGSRTRKLKAKGWTHQLWSVER